MCYFQDFAFLSFGWFLCYCLFLFLCHFCWFWYISVNCSYLFSLFLSCISLFVCVFWLLPCLFSFIKLLNCGIAHRLLIVVNHKARIKKILYFITTLQNVFWQGLVACETWNQVAKWKIKKVRQWYDGKWKQMHTDACSAYLQPLWRYVSTVLFVCLARFGKNDGLTCYMCLVQVSSPSVRVLI